MRPPIIIFTSVFVVFAVGVIGWKFTRGQPAQPQIIEKGSSQVKVTAGSNQRVDHFYTAIASADKFEAQSAALDLQIEDLPAVMARLFTGQKDVANEEVLSACLAVSPLMTASLVNELEHSPTTLGMKNIIMDKMSPLASLALADMRNSDLVHGAHPSAIVDVMRVHRDLLAKDFLSVANAFSALLAEGGAFDEQALQILKERQDTLRDGADLIKVLDYAHSSVGAVGEEGMKRLTERCRNTPVPTRSPLMDEIIRYSDNR